MRFLFIMKLSLFLIAIALNTNVLSQDNSIIANDFGTEVEVIENINDSILNIDNIYTIKGGTLKESNLFHSFSRFNVHEGEAANFNVEPGIQNVIARVTNEQSFINGPVTLSNAIGGSTNLYLINPLGFIFGGNFKLSVGGSFFTSTCDYLKFDTEEKMYAQIDENSVLTSAAPVAFGFLGNNIADIKIEGKGEVHIPLLDNYEELKPEDLFNSIIELPNILGGMHVEKGNSISLIAGNIVMDKGSKTDFSIKQNPDESHNVTTPIPLGTIMAENSTLNLFSVASKGEIDFRKDNFGTDSFEKLGTIELKDFTSLDIQSGNVHIRSDKLLMDDSIINIGAYRYEDFSSEFDSGGYLDIITNEMSMLHGSIISNNTYSTIKEGGGSIDIVVNNTFTISGENEGHVNSSIFSESNIGNFGGNEAISDAGNVNIKAKNIILNEGGIIVSTNGEGKAGDISLIADESIRIEGNLSTGRGSGLESKAKTKKGETGDAGTIFVAAKNISINDGGGFTTVTHNTAKGGDIHVNASESLVINGVNPHGRNSDGFSSGITTRSTGEGEHADNDGDAGVICIKAGSLIIKDGGGIESSSSGGGKAGNINISANKAEISGDSSNFTFKDYEWSQLDYRKEHPDVIDYSVSGIFAASESEHIYDDNGAGNIHLNITDQLTINNAEISTSVAQGHVNSGNINILNPKFVVLNKATIKANAFGGKGGNITIDSEYFFKSANTLISASSKLGTPGNIFIDSIPVEVSKDIGKLADQTANPSKWYDHPCSKRSAESISKLIINDKDGVIPPFDDYLASPAIPLTIVEKYYGSNISFQHEKNGEHLFQQGNFNQALFVWKKCMSTVAVDSTLFMPIKTYMSIAYQKTGQYQKSFLEIPTDDNYLEQMDNFNKAMALNMKGEIELLNRDKQSAITSWEKAIQHANETKNKFLIATVKNNLANVYELSDRHAEAVLKYESALADLERNRSFLKCVILLNLIRSKLTTNDHGFINLLAEKTHACIQKLPNTYHKAFYLLSLSSLLQKMFPLNRNDNFISTNKMHSIINQALSIGKEINNNAIISSALGLSGQLFEKQKNYSEALRLTRQAVFFARKNYPETLYQLQWQIGKRYESMGNTQEAINLYQQSIETMESFQYAFFMGYHNSELFYKEKVKPVYYGYVNLLLRSYEASGSLPLTTLKSAIKTIEQFKTTEIQNHFKDECINYLDKPIEIPEKMAEKTALIYPFSLSDRLVILTILPQGIQYYVKKISQKKLKKWIQRLDKRLDYRTYSVLRFNKYAHDLYDWLIRPMEKDLVMQNIKTIYISAEGKLQTIPFCALRDSKTDQYLMEKYAIAILPSISYINDAQETINSNRQRRILLCGLTQSRKGFSAIKGGASQLKDIQQYVGGKILINKDFTTHNFKKEFQASTPDIIHILTHGNVGNTPEDIFLLTYNGQLSLHHLETIIHSGVFRETPLDLLTLGACQTAIGDERFALGLAGIAFKTGAQNVIATLRPVEKNATTFLMTEFYKKCAAMNFSNKSIALQKAQSELLRSKKYSHPIFWSPFILLGKG
jgi:filamentous hemagglutinin family protein